MNIALCHFRVGETDGVSLEMDKWKIVLEKMGHSVHMIAGSTGSENGYVIPELHYKNDVNNRIVKNAYCVLDDYRNEEELRTGVEVYAYKIQIAVEKFLLDCKIDVLVPNNIWSLGWGLSAGLGIYNAVKKLSIKCIAHNHDFYWERIKYLHPTCEYVNDLLENYFPPKDELIKYVTINNIAKDELLKRKGIEATVVPNVFDFDASEWIIDDYNRDFKKAIGISDNDIFVLQATRIAERKAIELAIDVIGKMQKNDNLEQLYNNALYNGRSFTKENRIVFVMAGLSEAEDSYIEYLNKKAEKLGVKVLYINDVIEHSRGMVNGEKCYSLWDAYAHADLITYPSILEGWGNQLLEAIFAKKPIIVYEYPVYVSDLKQRCFDVISLGMCHEVDKNGLVTVDTDIISHVAKLAVELLINNKKRETIVKKNYEICKKYFSYESLERILNKLF
ncbi:MAG: glycosyltransferase family 4 protein [bacterium]|nr:glycosyltransferase family 4 protein [bacterium]